ncbi:MAG: response regulator [Deltaproteobacteria bacterium]|nr:response regulator [Deltaproteobacteria bacterium]MDQ3298884.1 ATP-binding protein [Myxococcota bacterium]
MHETLQLIAKLADPQTRRTGAAALARHFGVLDVCVFVPHPDTPSKLIPAPGFGLSLRSSRGWRDLLARCTTRGIHAGNVAYPDATSTSPAVAHAFEGIAFVLIGADTIVANLEPLDLLAPVLAAMLRAEAGVIAARGELEVERQASERASTLARALDLARADAERATHVKDEFLAMLGHELRNPLAPIVTALQMLRLEGVHTRAQDVLERQVSHVLRLVDDLLDVSRITSGKVELRKEVVEIASVVTRAIEMSRPILENRRSQLEIAVPPQGLAVDGDPARLAQVVSNLVTNAAKYSDVETPVRIAAERAGSFVRLTVEDRGIGIEPGQLDRVFEQFVQMPQGIDRALGGLGLGLAIVRNLVTMHGGSVSARSEGRGRGSRFTVELPASEAGPRQASMHAVTVEPKPKVESLQLLLVDDNPDAAELLAEIMAAYGHEVRVAHSGPDALAILESFEPDAGILDIGLPVMDGYELARRVRERLPDIRLIAVTGYGQPDDRKRTAAAGFDEHLVKPVTIANLTTTLERLRR